MDTVSKEQRSRNMSRVKGRNTKPELLVRSLLHRMGYRFRLHAGHLPGKPDIILPKYRAAIFVHGCFWHGHKGCGRAALPSTRREFWEKKIHGNMERDARALAQLTAEGMRCLVVWQCEMKDTENLAERLAAFLSGPEGDLPSENRSGWKQEVISNGI